MANIYIVRHGESVWNKLKIIHGQSNPPLSNEGKIQAELLAIDLMNINFDACFCSPLQRASVTAKTILKFHKNTPIKYDDRLLEIFLGDLEGVHSTNIDLFNETFELLTEHGVESQAHFFKRVKSFFDDYLTKWEDKNILIVSHCGTIRMCNFYFNPPEINHTINDYISSCAIKNCEVLKIENATVMRESPKLVEYTEFDYNREEFPLI